MILLGDEIKELLTSFGITEEVISSITGKKCNCKNRQVLLNRMSAWVSMFRKGKLVFAKEELDKIISEEINNG